jgi:hypothetical protein
MQLCRTCRERPVAMGTRGRMLKFCSPECRRNRAKVDREAARTVALAATTKTCGQCETELPVEQFHADARRLDGRYPWCKDCRRAYQGSKRRTGPAFPSKADYDRARRQALKSAPDYNDRWLRNYFWTAYRLTPEQYGELLAKQGGRCAVCGTDDPGKSRGREVGRFAVDHDHDCCPGRNSCGRCIRGLLCRGCNTGIGLLGDDPDRLAAAGRYIKEARRGRIEAA